MDVTSYLLGKKSGGGEVNNQNKDVTITENGSTTVNADAGYTGLGTVGIQTNVQPDLESKSITITENTTTTITPTQGKDGLSSVSVTTNVPTGDLSEYFNDTIGRGYNNDASWFSVVKKLPSSLTASENNLSYAFQKFKGTSIPQVTNTQNVTNMSNMFNGCVNVSTLDISTLDTSNVTNMSNMVANCEKLENIIFGNNFDTSNVTNMSNMFQGSFKNSDSLNLTLDISMFNFENVSNIMSMFDTFGTTNESIKTLIFGTNLGKGYSTTVSAHYTSYTLNLSKMINLTHDSLMSVINNLYDIATKGVQPQQLVLGATNLAKLSQAEQDIVTAKGWTLS